MVLCSALQPTSCPTWAKKRACAGYHPARFFLRLAFASVAQLNPHQRVHPWRIYTRAVLTVGFVEYILYSELSREMFAHIPAYA